MQGPARSQPRARGAHSLPVAQQRAQQTLVLSRPGRPPSAFRPPPSAPPPRALAAGQLALLSSPLLTQRRILLEGWKKGIDLSLYMHICFWCVCVCMCDYLYLYGNRGREGRTQVRTAGLGVVVW